MAPARTGVRPADARRIGGSAGPGAVPSARRAVGFGGGGTAGRLSRAQRHRGRSAAPQTRRRPGGVALDGELDDAEAHVGEGVAALGRHRREEADRREPGDRVDLRHDDALAGHQEVDPREALGADRPVHVAGELVDHGALDVA